MKKSLFFMIVILSIAHFDLTAQSRCKIARTIPVQGDGFWDYITVDETHARLFVSHQSVVQVIDLKTGKQTGMIPDTKGVHGVALVPAMNKGYTSNGRDSSLTVFNLTTLAVIGKIRVSGENPDAILYDDFSKKVFTGNGRSHTFSVIDVATDKEIKVIPLDGKPEAIATDGKGNIYVNIEDKSMIDMLDANSLQVTGRWSISPGEEPTGLAIDTETHRLFSVCGNKLMIVVDAISGKVLTTVPIGDGCDGAAFDPVSKQIYSSNGEGTLTVVKENSDGTFKVLENFQTKRGARTIALDKSSHHIYLPTAEFEAGASTTQSRPTMKAGSFMVLDIETSLP